MKKALIYGLSAALLLVSLTACHKPQADQPAEPDPTQAATSTQADVSTPEPLAAPEPEPPEQPSTTPEQLSDTTPAAPDEVKDTEPPEETAPEKTAPAEQAEQPPEATPPTTEPVVQQPSGGGQPQTQQTPQGGGTSQTQQTTSSTQKIDGHDDLGDYVLNGKGGKYYPALNITLPVSYNGQTHEGIDFSEPPGYSELTDGIMTGEEHAESWNGVRMG